MKLASGLDFRIIPSSDYTFNGFKHVAFAYTALPGKHFHYPQVYIWEYSVQVKWTRYVSKSFHYN